MHVVRFPVELGEFGTSSFANASEYLAHRLNVNGVKHASSILWREDQMGVQQKDAMASRAIFGRGFWHRITCVNQGSWQDTPMLNATKIRLYPTTGQAPIFAAQFGCTRVVWNQALGMKKAAWEERQESLSCYTIKSMLPVWKAGEFPWLKDGDSQALQQTILNLDVAYENFFAKRAKFPRFKKKHASRQSFQYPQRVTLGEGSVFLPKIGHVNAVIHRPILGKIKTVTIARESTGKYFASILADDGLAESEPLQYIESITGMDVGLKDVVASSSGKKTGNPKFLKRSLKNLKRKQQALSRKIEAAKKRGIIAGKPLANLRDFFGSNMAKDRKKVARAHERVRNCRTDFQHNVSRQLADENQAVAAETLNVKGMMKNRRLSAAIADVGWNGLLTKVEYKLKRKGGRMAKIDRWFPSSKRCSCCGTINKELKLSDRTWRCVACGKIHDRDDNASQNIRTEGIVILKAAGLSVSAHGGGVSPALIAQAAANEVGSLRLQA